MFRRHKPQPCFPDLECHFPTHKQSEAFDDKKRSQPLTWSALSRLKLSPPFNGGVSRFSGFPTCGGQRKPNREQQPSPRQPKPLQVEHGDTVREAASTGVVDLKKENEQLKQLVAELSLKNGVLKRSVNGLGFDCEEQ